MKKILVYCSLLSLILAGCEDDNAPALFDCPFTPSPSTDFNTIEPEASWGMSMDRIPAPPEHPCDYVKAQKNGAQWTAHASSFFTGDSDTLNIMALGNEETLRISFLFKGTGNYKILPVGQPGHFNDNAYFFTTVGRDVIIDYYNLLQEGFVQIVEYNEAENLIKGVFNLPFIEYPTSDAPKMLFFAKGSFSVHLPD